MKIKVEEQFDRFRLDKFLTASLSDRTRAFLQKLIKDGQVLVDGKAVRKVGFLMKIDSEVEIHIPKPKEIKAKAEKIALDIIHEDDDIIVVNKSAGMVVHPSETGAHMTGTLVNAILHHCKGALKGISGELRPGIVHRLDKNTSGVLVVAKTDVAHQSLMNQFKDRKIGKKYVALVIGSIEPKHAIIDSPIGRSISNRKKMAIVNEGKGRNAITEYWAREEFEDKLGEYSLLDIDLKTGRTHQIRVHLNAIGYSVVGDITYGDKGVNSWVNEEYDLDRQFLHAAELTIKHPKTEKVMSFEAPLPDDLLEVLESLRSSS
jgi:23S rRNA pseudouridine1911/1915/1917 synthase